MCLKIYEIDAAKIFSTPGLTYQVALKKGKLKLNHLIDTSMLLKIEKGIRRGIFHFVYRYAEANSKYMKDYGKESSYLHY